METRASHLIVGLFVLLLSIGTVLFGVWLAKRDVDQTFTTYEILFEGSVFGLQQGSQVVFSGVPVGRVTAIAIDRDDPSKVLVTVELAQTTPVTTATTAMLVPQGVTGLVVVELRGGDPAAPPPPAPDGAPPRIAGLPSALEQVFTSTPLLLARGVTVLERLGTALSDANIEALGETLDHVEALTRTLAERGDDLDRLLGIGAELGEEARATLAALAPLAALGPSGEVALAEVEAAAVAARNLAWRIDRLLAESEQPIIDFGDGGLYEFGEMVREIRVPVAALSRIATDFERDPAGFIIGGSRRGFTPP